MALDYVKEQEMLNSIVLPSQAVVPLGVAIAHLALIFFIIYRRRFRSYVFPHIFVAYLLLTFFWNINLVIVVNNFPTRWPGLSWTQLAPYGLGLLGLLYWMFARAFLQTSWKSPWTWLLGITGLAGLALAVSLDLGWILLPAPALAWSGGRVSAANLGFMAGVLCWWLFIAGTLAVTSTQLSRTQSPAHKNRIQYLLLATVALSVGYGLYLTLAEPFWTAGLLVTWLGNTLTGYIVTVENLIDLGTGIRRTVRWLVIITVTIALYMVGIYLVQIFLGDFLAATFLARFLDPVLLVAVVTAVLLTIVHTPVTRFSRNLTDRLLFGRHYDFQTVIQQYTQSISNILYLDELADAALNCIKQNLGINQTALFMLDFSGESHYHFRTLPYKITRQFPETLALRQDTPVMDRLIRGGQPLAQYTLDISPHFQSTPEAERAALKAMGFEWYIPIIRKQELIGIFALGPKTSKQAYSNQDLQLLTTLADQTGLALENASLVDRLQQNYREIARMKNLMDNVFDSMDNAVITTDLAGKITLFNKAAETILALPPAEQSIGKPYNEVLPALATTIFPNLVANVLKRQDHYADYELISEVPGRGRVNLSLNLAPLKDAYNQIRGVTMVMDDLTETKRLQAVQDMFRRYVSPAVVDRLPSDPSKLELGGHRQVVTVLFADIRGFTSFSEKLPPEKLVDILNEYLSMAAASILMFEGTLDKFMGDAVMGIFNAPLEQNDHALRAVRAAAAMQKAIADYHRNMAHERNLSFGIGIHVGEAVVGNIGMSDRMDYTAIGDTVNLAKRIQENTPGNKVLISEDVYKIVNGSVRAIFFKEMTVKGRRQPVKTYELRM